MDVSLFFSKACPNRSFFVHHTFEGELKSKKKMALLIIVRQNGFTKETGR
ncbi:hypothetical protein JCM14469_24500 [Desulfatiferula olefinivorans]